MGSRGDLLNDRAELLARTFKTSSSRVASFEGRDNAEESLPRIADVLSQLHVE